MKRFISLLILISLVGNNGYSALSSKGLDKNQFTSDFMMGNVVVSVIFPESDGSFDPNTETWSSDRKTQALSQIMNGLNWWTRQNTRSPLTFTVVSETVATKYEPITRPYYDESLWIPDVMTKLGFPGNRFISVRNYVNNLRTTHHADWGFVVFVVDSVTDTNGKFSDGLFAYAYLGGPFLVLTYDNNGYGISNMDVVLAHETGHIFHALDQYAGASSPNDVSTGYFPTINGNHAYSRTANDPNSIMRGGLRWGLDNWSRLMIGWRDSNSNNRDDILDQNPTATLASQLIPISSGVNGYAGEASISILPRQSHSQGYGLSVDSITKVEYKMSSGDWIEAQATDGQFNSAQEDFNVAVPASNSVNSNSVQAQSVDLRVTTYFSSRASSGGGSGGGSSSGSAPSLQDAHAFPNPFKPNSNLGHDKVTFTGLTNGAKLQIFTAAGEPVYEKTAAPGATTIPWLAVNDSGKDVASGVYLYLITDAAGHKKEGKIAVIR